MATYYQPNPAEYIGVTNEHPKGFPNLWVGHDGTREWAWTTDQLASFKKVSVDEVPDYWLKAIGYDERVAITTETDLEAEVYVPTSERNQSVVGWMLLGILLSVLLTLLGVL